MICSAESLLFQLETSHLAPEQPLILLLLASPRPARSKPLLIKTSTRLRDRTRDGPSAQLAPSDRR